jgi:hypothetical protein
MKALVLIISFVVNRHMTVAQSAADDRIIKFLNKVDEFRAASQSTPTIWLCLTFTNLMTAFRICQTWT